MKLHGKNKINIKTVLMVMQKYNGDPQLVVGSAVPSYHLWVSISQIRQINVLIGENLPDLTNRNPQMIIRYGRTNI